jgi:phosphatidylserine/phosphatidylglycerophosphate/cardiolipin synthase-like enzyme
MIERLKRSKKRVKIMAPYYYPMRVLEKELIAAAERGVEIEIITARKRDIPCYRNLKNAYLIRKLIDSGITVYQVKDKYLHMKGTKNSFCASQLTKTCKNKSDFRFLIRLGILQFWIVQS